MAKRIRQVPIEISARHAHLSHDDVRRLFGAAGRLAPARPISQPGQFVARQRVTLVGPAGALRAVGIVGPERLRTQVELSTTDARALGVSPKLRVSGDVSGTTGGLTMRGPRGARRLRSGVIIAHRHLHIQPSLAKAWKLRHHQKIAIRVSGTRPLVFQDVVVRSRNGIDALAFHLDTDEGNAAGVRSGGKGQLA